MSDDGARTDHLEWTHLPLKGRIGAKVFLALLLPGLGIGVFLEARSLPLALLAVAFVAVAISPAVVPTRYVLGADGVTVKHLGRTTLQPWSAFRRLLVDADVLVLSPFVKPSFLDTFRGLYLRFNRDQAAVREEALRRVLPRIQRHEERHGEADRASS